MMGEVCSRPRIELTIGQLIRLRRVKTLLRTHRSKHQLAI